MGKGGTASPTTDTLPSAKAGKGESDGLFKLTGKPASSEKQAKSEKV